MTSVTICLELSSPALPANIRDARNCVAKTVAALGTAQRVVDDVRVCVSEAVSNVVRHAYGRKPGDFQVVVGRKDDELHVVVRDEGGGIGTPTPRGEGGYGLQIVERLALRHTLTSAPEAGTELHMVFSLVPEQQGATPAR